MYGISGVTLDDLFAAPSAPPPGERLGTSREGRPVTGYRFGTGPVALSLIGGCHADEPVGPWLLDRLIACLAHRPERSDALERYQWWIVPHVNPDGEARNAAWTEPLAEAIARDPETARADGRAYGAHVVREQPGDDVEFGFPRDDTDTGARPETRAVHAWWRTRGAPFDLHASLHGMGVARGPWFLVEPAWRDRIGPLVETCRAEVARMGYRLHDDARTGDKGFDRITEGFSTRPDSRAMIEHFERAGDPEMAARFRPSSMETIVAMGGDPLTLVTEMPLFIAPSRPPGVSAAEVAASGEAEPMPVADQWRLQWTFVEAGIALRTGAGA